MDQVTFDFSFALLQVRRGNPIRRLGWNGKNMSVTLAKTKLKWEDTPIEPFLIIHTADGKWVPWTISQADILADDWTLV